MGRYRARAVGVLAMVIASRLAGGLASADPAPDFEHAKQLYRAAESAMASGHYAQAVTAFAGAYEITKDPVLFYKLGTASQKLGKCDVAVGYFGRYLKEAHPTEKYVALTRQHLAECSATAPVQPPVHQPTNPVEPRPVAVAPVVNPGEDVGLELTAPLPPPPPPPPPVHHAHGARTGWLLVGGALAFATVGAVLAYSASSSEHDISDLYVGLNGTPPTFDTTTQRRYNDLVDEGHRYQYLSWAAFGIAGGAAIAATLVFALGGDDSAEHPSATHARIVPTLSPSTAGLAAAFRF